MKFATMVALSAMFASASLVAHAFESPAICNDEDVVQLPRGTRFHVKQWSGDDFPDMRVDYADGSNRVVRCRISNDGGLVHPGIYSLEKVTKYGMVGGSKDGSLPSNTSPWSFRAQEYYFDLKDSLGSSATLSCTVFERARSDRGFASDEVRLEVGMFQSLTWSFIPIEVRTETEQRHGCGRR